MIKTGFIGLDELIGGYKEEISCIYGVPASGKTTLAMLVAIEQSKEGKKVLFLDTENGFSVERFIQLSKDEDLLKNIFLINIKNFKEQCTRIDKIVTIADMFSLIIVDSIGAQYRGLVVKNPEKINKLLYKQLENLKEISRKNIPILVTNQVYFNIDKKKINLVGGEILKNNSGCLIELEKKSKKRKVIVRKPFEKEIMFEIKDGELI